MIKHLHDARPEPKWERTNEFRARNLPAGGPGVLEQLWRRGAEWEWRCVPLVPDDAPLSGRD